MNANRARKMRRGALSATLDGTPAALEAIHPWLHRLYDRLLHPVTCHAVCFGLLLYPHNTVALRGRQLASTLLKQTVCAPLYPVAFRHVMFGGARRPSLPHPEPPSPLCP